MLALGLNLPMYGQSSSTPSDTLRRNLTVLTSEVVELGERMPEKSSIPMSTPPALSPHKYEPTTLPLLVDALSPTPLMGLDSLQPIPPRHIPLGYVTASLGLSYNAHLSAGIRPINKEDRQLDFHLASFWSKYKYYHSPTMEQQLGQSALRLGIQYSQRLSSLYYKAQSSFYTDSYPSQGLMYDATKLSSSPSIEKHTSSNTRSYLFRLGGEFGSTKTDGSWQYLLIPQLAVARRGNAQDIELSLAGKLSYTLDDSHINLRSDLALWNCAPQSISRYTLSHINLTPSWEITRQEENWGWYADLGATIGFGSRRAKQLGGLMISPYIAAGVTLADWIKLHLDVDGGISGRPLSEVIDRHPYLRINSPEALRHTPLNTRLKFELLPLSNLSIGIYGGFARHSRAEGIAAITLGHTLIRHQRYYADANHWHIGGSLRYRTKQYLDLEISAKYDRWQEDNAASYLGGEPRLTLGTSVSLTPSERYHVSLGYHLIGDYRIPTENLATLFSYTSTHNLGLVGQLTASGTYQITPRLNLLGYAHYITTPNASRVIGFPTERFRANVGININF